MVCFIRNMNKYEMKEAQNTEETNTSDASVENATKNNTTGKENKGPETQMDYDWSNDDLLGDEHELNESARIFLSQKRRSDKCEECSNNCSVSLWDVVSTGTHVAATFAVCQAG